MDRAGRSEPADGAGATAPGPGSDPVTIDLRDDAAILGDAAPVALVATDRHGRVVLANSAWGELWGGDLEGAAEGWLDRLRADSRQALLALLHQVDLDGKTRSADHELLVDGGWRWTRWWIGRTGEAGVAVVIAAVDVDGEHVERDALRFRATHDPLTGLINRAQFVELTDRALHAHRRHPESLAVLYIDLDDFKAVNDTYGHGRGDRVLVKVAQTLLSAVRPEDLVARIGGDEFAIMCDRLADRTDATVIEERVRVALGDPLDVDGTELRVTASIGLAYANGARDAPEAILDRADRAMYEEKRRDAPDRSPPRSSS